MSLFLAKQYWGTQVACEEFDEKHLQVDESQIYVASFAGMLRLYKPIRGEYKANQLVCEYKLSDPIMQILIGNFSQKSICVLYFKKIAFYTMQMVLIKEHQLPRNGFNMCLGQFGGVKKDLICVQSCDAMLMIYEAEQLLCMSQLSTEYFPLPGPMEYSQLLDGFILQNSCNELEYYKYSNLVAQSQKQDEKRAQPNWTVNLGEQAQKIIEVSKYNIIYVIGESMLFTIETHGIISQQKKLDYPPASMVVTNDKTILISSFTHHLMVYRDFKLVWAAKTDYICHGLMVNEFNGIGGLVTMLNDEGHLQVLFMGTEQMSITSELKQDNQYSYSQMEEMYSSLVQQIAKKEGGGGQIKQKECIVNMDVEVLKTRPTKEYVDGSEQYLQINGMVMQCQVKITIHSSRVIQTLNVLLSGDMSIYLDPNVLSADRVDGNIEFQVSVYSTKIACISGVVQMSASWNGGCCQSHFRLPMGLYCYMIAPEKSAEYKITLITDQLMVLDTFKDLKGSEDSTSNPNAMTLQFTDSKCTILASKSNDKWRLQSDKFESLCYLLDSLMIRVPDKISFTDQIPLQDIFNVIDQHNTLKLTLHQQEIELEQKATEFRAIQKKLLSKFKENNPSHFGSLDELLQQSFNGFMKLMQSTQQCKLEYQQCEHKLQVVIHLMLLLIKLRFNVKQEQYNKIYSLFQAQDDWEQDVYTNINYYLKQQLAIDNDVSKVKKIITILIDKISKCQL